MKNKKRIIIVGAGHAGIEAATAASRAGANCLLITMKESDIGAMSCNPAFGGVGKGHIVREIDACDGVMARSADAASIQYRLLNRSKGPAVRGPRVQADRYYYHLACLNALKNYPDIKIIFDEATEILTKQCSVTGVATKNNGNLPCDKLIICGGTFLNASLHFGSDTFLGGRVGDNSSTMLGKSLRSFDLACKRLKTGTPPRLLRSSINWEALEQQQGDQDPTFMSLMTSEVALDQVNCAITFTNKEIHELIQENIKESPIYSGELNDSGPRYCPSIEDKIVRFSHRERHQIFLEPEGLKSDTVYPNGISTALPAWLQLKFVRMIKGCEQCEITQNGYAVSYDYFDPRNLKPTLESKVIKNLYLAGQVNGTTGYEEAGAQGLVAGANAALENDEFILDRGNSYIGVMIDDLITRGVTEPYRMLTARAEYRLKLRIDNAEARLSDVALKAGLLKKERIAFFQKRNQLRIDTKDLWQKPIDLTPLTMQKDGSLKNINKLRTLNDAFAIFMSKFAGNEKEVYKILLEAGIFSKSSDFFKAIQKHNKQLDDLDAKDKNQKLDKDSLSEYSWLVYEAAIDALYSGYLPRIERDIADFRKEQTLQIPKGFDFKKINGLSNEAKERLTTQKPKTLADASRLEGMTSSAITLIIKHLKNHNNDRRRSQNPCL